MAACDNVPIMTAINEFIEYSDYVGNWVETSASTLQTPGGINRRTLTGYIAQIETQVNTVESAASAATTSINNDRQAISNLRDGAEQDFQDAIGSLTVTAPFDFTEGGTVAARNQAILWPVADGGDGSQYRWDGALPKTVPPASTPDSTGGVEVGAWVDVGQAALRSDLANPAESGNRVARMPITADSFIDLLSVPFINGRTYQNNGFYPDTVVGGGSWKAVSNADLTQNNGGTFVSKAALQAWYDVAVAAGGVTTTNLQANLNVLFTAGTGTGDAFVRVYEQIYADDFGAIKSTNINGADSSRPLEQMQASLGFVNLMPFGEYRAESLPRNYLVLKGFKSVIHHSRTLATSQFVNLDIDGIILDGNNQDFTRSIKVLANSKIKLRDVIGRNIQSTTFLRQIDISTENVDIDIDGCQGINLSAQENGIIGDINGSCRFIYMGDEPDVTVTKPSRGEIKNIYGLNLMPIEDGDLIQLQSFYDPIFPIKVQGVYGLNIAKRLVKIQCNGPDVDNIYADAVENTDEMYAIVSHYGKSGSVSRVRGFGKFTLGVDTESDGVKVKDVKVKTTVTLSGSAVCSSAFSCDFEDLYGEGFECISKNHCAEEGGVISVKKVRGKPTVCGVKARADANVSKFKIRDVDCDVQDVTGALSLVLFQRFVGTSFVFEEVDLESIQGYTPYFSAVSLTACNKSKVNNVKALASSMSLEVIGGEVEAFDVDAKGMNRAVLLSGTSKALIVRPKGATLENVRLRNACDNTVVLNSIANPGVVDIYDETGDATNTQEIGSVKYL